MRTLLLTLFGLLILASCSSDEATGWTVEGKIDNYKSGTMVTVEYLDKSGSWLPLDTLEVKGDGTFSYRAKNPSAVPDIFRLRMADRVLVFPVLKDEKVTVKTDAAHFGDNVTLSGNQVAEAFTLVDKIVADSVEVLGVKGTLKSDGVKRRLYAEVVADDQNGLAAYYVAIKTVDGKPLFDLSQRSDVRMFTGVAEQMRRVIPDDPRTKAVVAAAEEAQRLTSSGKNAVKAEATVVKIPYEISLTDSRGNLQTLSEVASKGKPVVLSFALYSDKDAPAYTLQLNDAYTAYHPKGLEIYQVCMDGNRNVWIDGSRSLPWISTYLEPGEEARRVLLHYNINTSAPTTFILNSEGEISERVDNPKDLKSALAKYF